MFRAHEPAEDDHSERLVAIKVFRLDITQEQAEGLTRALERLVASRIDHPAVAAPIAAGLDGSSPYLAMQYVVGESLDARGVSAMPLDEVVRIVERLASAIDECIDRRVYHGLLHPRDVMMSADGPRLTGFGIAEALLRIGAPLPLRRPYAPPSGYSDVYSLAAIAYELISGRRMTPSGWDEFSAVDGPELRDAFAAALSPDPRARPHHAEEFASKLRKAAANAGGQSIPEAVVPVSAEHAPSTPVVPWHEPVPAPELDVPGPLPGPIPDIVDEPTFDRFADPAATTDLHMEFSEREAPIVEIEREDEPTMPLAHSATSTLFQSDEIESGSNSRAKFAVLILVGLIAAGLLFYALRSRQVPRTASVTPASKPSVSSTTVDLPEPKANPQPASPPQPPPKTIPPEPRLPAPTPSRPAAGVAPSNRNTAQRGRLLIRSTPADASVSINGQARGKTPLTVRDLALGSYTIRVARDGFAAVDRRVRLTSQRPSAAIEIPLKSAAPRSAAAPTATGDGSLLVESRPAGARVFVNDRLIGSTPLAVPGLPAGPAAVRIEMDGYQTWATTVRVAAGEQTRVAASLDRP